MKGIILAGGSGTRLNPTTKGVSKQLLPVYDKPLIYYPINLLLASGIREILVITTPRDKAAFQNLLGNGSQWGISLEYAVQPSPDGLAQAFIIGEEFIGSDKCALVLGDNILHGDGLFQTLQSASKRDGATIFSYSVKNPSQYGVLSFDADGQFINIVEKPQNPPSNQVAIGLYFFDNDVIDIAKTIEPSSRGELEIADVINAYGQTGRLHVEKFGRGYAWFDAGTSLSLLDAANFVHTLEARQDLKIACLEEVSYELGLISIDDLRALANAMGKSDYGEYLVRLLARISPNR